MLLNLPRKKFGQSCKVNKASNCIQNNILYNMSRESEGNFFHEWAVFEETHSASNRAKQNVESRPRKAYRCWKRLLHSFTSTVARKGGQMLHTTITKTFKLHPTSDATVTWIYFGQGIPLSGGQDSTKLNFTQSQDANLLRHRKQIYSPLCSYRMEVNGSC